MDDWAIAPASEPAMKRSAMPRSRWQPVPTFSAHFIYNVFNNALHHCNYEQQVCFIIYMLHFMLKMSNAQPAN